MVSGVAAAQVPLLRSLSEEEQLKIAALLKPKEFEDGENIITQGEEGDCMYFIQSGEVSPAPTVTPRFATPRRQCSSGRTHHASWTATQQAEAVVDGVGVVMEYGFGGFFGELALRTSAPRAATVRAKVSESHCRQLHGLCYRPHNLPRRTAFSHVACVAAACLRAGVLIHGARAPAFGVRVADEAEGRHQGSNRGAG